MMKIRPIIFFGFITLLFFTSSCRKERGYIIIEDPVVNHNEIQDITERAEIYADSMLVAMTLEERAGQCLMPSILTSSDESTISLFKELIEQYHIGGIVLLKGDVASAKCMAEIGEKSTPPMFIAIDAEWGLGMRLKDASVYPKNGNIHESTEETELYDYGREVARECKEIGINMVLGPVVDVTSKKSGAIGKRSFGNNPKVVSNFGIAYAKGLESGGVVSVAKHFPGHGSSVIDSHKGVAKVNRDISGLDTLDLKPFRDYINSGLTAIMAGHIQSYALDPDGNAASISMDMLTRLLKEEMGFKGMVLTDAFDMGGARGFSATDALKAGADIILCPENVGYEYRNILDNVKEGRLDLKVLDERVRKILFIKYLFLINQP